MSAKKGLAYLVAAILTLGFVGDAMAISSSFVSLLYGGNVVDEDGKANAGHPDGYGVVSLNFPTDRKLCYSIYTVNIDTSVRATIVFAPAGVNGVKKVGLKAFHKGLGSGIASACIKIKPALVREIRARPADYYIEVATKKFPAGAVRGQLL